MSEQVFHIIGISDNPEQELSRGALAAIAWGKVFSGGQRHRELMESHMPANARWIPITVPLQAVFEQYRGHGDVVVFASGDPLFYGFAATVRREIPDAVIDLYPSFNSMQMLAHRLLLPYQDMHAVSLTGRPWKEFDAALISGEKMIGVLTDRNKTPRSIAQRMLDYGYDNYTVSVGECLGNPEKERVTTVSVSEASAMDFAFPNCMILRQTSPKNRPLGIPETEFNLLDGRARMITKMPVRLLSLSMLDLRQRSSFWDVGFCTGSVSIEAKLQFPHLEVTAFEVREQGRDLIDSNSRRFGTPGITAVIGDFLDVPVEGFPAPDAVFIGGHGGHMTEMLQKIDSVLKPGGVIVFNSVSEESLEMFRRGIEIIGRKITGQVRVAVDAHNPIEILKAE